MTALIIIGAILLFFAFILSLRGVITIAYSDELSLSVRVLFVNVKLLPKKTGARRVRSMSPQKADRIERKLAAKAEKKRAKKALKKQKKDAEKKEKKKASLSDILGTVDLALTIAKTALGAFFGHLRVDVARFKIRVATGDAATTAVAYGAVSQAVAYLIAFLDGNKRVKGLKKADMDIVCDFLGDSPEADVKLSFSLRVWHLLHIALAALIKLIKHKFNELKKNDTANNNGSNKN